MKLFKKQCQNIDFCGETTENNQKSSSGKFKKRFAVGCLAVLMCGTALFGVACTPATSGTQGIGSSSSANGGGNLGTNTSPFGLDPANDPVVYTTASGLEIKCSNALTNTNLASYTYFTMGEYNGTPVNWVVIGYDPSVSGYVGEYTGDFNQGGLIEGGHNVNSTLDNSPMGNAIRKEFFAISNSAADNNEIGDGCVLCLSELNLGKSIFGSSDNYEGSTLQSSINTLFESTLKFTKYDKSCLVPQTLTNRHYNGVSTSTNCYLFPLASWGENFMYDSYLPDTSLRIIENEGWWFRSGSSSSSAYAGHVNSSGGVLGYTSDGSNRIGRELGVRPAFVMELI